MYCTGGLLRLLIHGLSSIFGVGALQVAPTASLEETGRAAAGRPPPPRLPLRRPLQPLSPSSPHQFPWPPNPRSACSGFNPGNAATLAASCRCGAGPALHDAAGAASDLRGPAATLQEADKVRSFPLCLFLILCIKIACSKIVVNCIC